MQAENETKLRAVESLLAGGLATRTEPVPADDSAFGEILAELRQVERDDVARKLVIGGFTLQPHGADQQCCRSCMYYLTNRKWCDLPELSLPVKAGWWCRLWRI